MLSTHAIEGLYRSHARHLQHVVRGGADAPDEVVEDACQQAWTSVIAHRARVDEQAAFGWLITTAVHAAWRLAEPRVACSWPPEPDVEDDARRRVAGSGPCALMAPVPTPPEVVELRERLAQVRRLPTRQQRLIWLYAAGHSYGELAEHEGITVRTVQRQLLRGRQAALASHSSEGG